MWVDTYYLFIFIFFLMQPPLAKDMKILSGAGHKQEVVVTSVVSQKLEGK